MFQINENTLGKSSPKQQNSKYISLPKLYKQTHYTLIYSADECNSQIDCDNYLYPGELTPLHKLPGIPAQIDVL